MQFGDGGVPVKDTKIYTDKPVTVIPQTDNSAVSDVQDSAVTPASILDSINPATHRDWWVPFAIVAIPVLLIAGLSAR